MTDIILLSIHNILRNLKRVAITILSIMVGFAALACLGGFFQFSYESLRESTIRSQIGHVQIYADGYGENHITSPDAVIIADPAPLIGGITAIPGVELVTPRLSFSGLGSAGGDVVNMSVIGVDLDKERIFSSFEVTTDGRRLRPTDTDGGIVGEQLLKALGAQIGDWVTIQTNTASGVLNAVDFRIVGAVRTRSVEYDAVFVKIPIELARQVREVEGGAGRLIVLLEDTDALPAIRPQIENFLGERGFAYEIREWTELATFYNAVSTLYTGVFRIFAAIIGVVVMFAVASTMVMAVAARENEIGALRAMGMSRGRLVAMFLAEAIWVGLLGAALGALASWGIAAGIGAAGGIAMPPPPGSSEGFVAFLTITPEIYGIAFVAVFPATLLSALYPAFTASRVKVLTAFSLRLFQLRHEWRNLLADIMQEHDISVEEWLLLASLDEAKGGLSMTELSAGQGMNMPGVTKNVDKLIGRGLVERGKGGEASRRVLIRLAAPGQKLLAGIAGSLESQSAQAGGLDWREITRHIDRA